MKIILTSIAAFALAHAAHAKTWAWFHEDIGIASPFVSSSSPAMNVTTRAVTKPKLVAKHAVARTKNRPADQRVIAR
jgi:hypothetical protein